MSPDGSTMFVTGYKTGAPGTTDYATAAYDAATGRELWSKRYNGPERSYDYAEAIAASPDGSMVVVTGYSFGSGTGPDYATVAYEAGTGATLWGRRYNGPANDVDEARALAVSPDGSMVVVTGDSVGSGTEEDFAIVAYSLS